MKTHESECQEECLRCGKMYLVSSAPVDGANGKPASSPNFCRNCLNSSIYGNKDDKPQSTAFIAAYEEQQQHHKLAARYRAVYNDSASATEEDEDEELEEDMDEDEECYGSEIDDNNRNDDDSANVKN